jgi:glycosyltransferase involved in cell wall biosynthesis
MKLIIQIPCLNERETLPITVADLPRLVEGFDSVEFLVIDDGSTDGTAELARSIGVDHVIQMNGNQGLARAFTAGLVAAVERGADVIVNTDADNQYDARDIPNLVRPIVEGRADLVVGARPIANIEHFSPIKRKLQGLGSRVVRAVSGADVADAPSGFRAMTRDTALRLNVFGRFTYTIETIIQAGLSNLRIVNTPVRVNGPTRPSRLFRTNLGYIRRSIHTMLSVYVIYRPVQIFSALSAGFLAPALLLGLRYAYFMATGEGKGHIQSVIAVGVLSLCGVFMAAIGIVAHLQSINRRLLEEIRYLERSRRFQPRVGTADRLSVSEERPVFIGSHVSPMEESAHN